MKWSLYGVFVGSKFGVTTNKKQALAFARKHGGFVTRMPYPGDTHYWDAPTFRVCSFLIADVRGEETL